MYTNLDFDKISLNYIWGLIVVVVVAMVVVVAVAARHLQPGVDVLELHPAPDVERRRLDRPVDERSRLPKEGHAHTPVEQNDADPRSGAREREALENEWVACGGGRDGLSGVGLQCEARCPRRVLSCRGGSAWPTA